MKDFYLQTGILILFILIFTYIDTTKKIQQVEKQINKTVCPV